MTMRAGLKLAAIAVGLCCLGGCGYAAAVAGDLAGGQAALGGIFGRGAGSGTGAGGGGAGGIPAFVNPFQQTPIAQPGVFAGAGGTGP